MVNIMVRTARILAAVYTVLVISLVHCHEQCPANNCECKDKEVTCWNVTDMEEMENIMKSIRKKSVKARTFRLRDTLLPALPEKLFADTKLEKLDFNNVKLPFIAPPVKDLSPFTGLEKLEEIHFSGVSYMYNWNWTMFANLNDLVRFFAEDSLFIFVSKHFSDMKTSLKHLRLINCQIHWIEDGAFSGFEDISNFLLTDNYISSFPRSLLPTPARHLVKIDLSNNKLEALASDLFDGMPTLSAVTVSGNNLQRLPEDLLKYVTKGFTFYVEGNPFICDCDLHWICRSSKVRVDYGQTTCSFPKDNQIERMCESSKEECKKGL